MTLEATAQSKTPATKIPADRSRSFRGALNYGILFAGILGLGAAPTALGNFALNPLIYSRSQQIAAAIALSEQHGIAVPDTNLDWRGLRREHILRMSDTPDIVIFGGSRWQEATSDLAPERKLYNSFVSNDQFEDMMAMTELLYETHHLPKTLILSVRFSTFEYLNRRDSSWWKSFNPEYRRMAARLGVEPHSWVDTLPVGKWLNLLSLDALLGKLRQYSELHAVWRVTDSLSERDLDVIGADGGLRFSDRHLRLTTLAYARENAMTMAALHRVTRLKVDPVQVAQLGELIAFLKREGVNVVFAQTPFHPVYFQAIRGTPYYEDLQDIETKLNRLAATAGATVTGSFDAAREGCGEEDYRDFNHARLQCLKRIVTQSLN